MATPLLQRSVNDLLYDYSLSAAYRNQWLYDPDFALAKEPDIWEIVRRDAVIASAIERRFRAVVRPWRVEPPEGSKEKEDKQAAAIVSDALKCIDGFNSSRRLLATSIALGRSYAFIHSEPRWVKLGGLPRMLWYVPTKLQHVDRRRFHWVPNRFQVNGEWRMSTSLEFFNVTLGAWEPLRNPELFVKYTHWDSEDRIGYGRGLLEATYFYHYAKAVTYEKIAQGIDKWANGVWIASLDGLRNSSTGKTNEDLRLSAKSVLQKMRSEHAAVLERVDAINVLETSGSGHLISMDYMRYLDEGLERLWNASVRPSGSASGESGARAQAETESDSSEAFYQADREEMDEALTRDLIGWFYLANELNFRKLGLDEAPRPHIDSEQQKKEDPLEAAQVATALLGAGVPLVKANVYHKTGFEMPTDDDDVFEGINPAEQQEQQQDHEMQLAKVTASAKSKGKNSNGK